MRKLLQRSVPAVLFAFLLALPFRPSAQTVAAPDQPADLTQTHGKAIKAVKANKMLGVRRIEPGRDIEPKFSDSVRVGILLKIIENVYYGRPLQFPKDGVIFQNRENRLPPKAQDYYHEYTVLPPNGTTRNITVGDQEFVISPPQGTRGAERLIIGGGEIAYYSPDHYKTFIELTIVR
jgi:guanyl-specific ribonuclease Sa